MLFNQFYDIIPGTSLTEVHKQTEKELAEVIDKVNEVVCDATDSVIDNGNDCKTVFNYTPCRLTIGLDIKAAYITDMLERNKEELNLTGNEIALGFKAFEVITVRETRLTKNSLCCVLPCLYLTNSKCDLKRTPNKSCQRACDITGFCIYCYDV